MGVRALELQLRFGSASIVNLASGSLYGSASIVDLASVIFSGEAYVAKYSWHEKKAAAESRHLEGIARMHSQLPSVLCSLRAGNYYSLKGQHEKAVTYFLKALRLDRRCLSAWTLMGHEFVELKNSGAAIEAYRQAVGECQNIGQKET